MKKRNRTNETGSTAVVESGREYQRGYFQGFAAAKKQDIKLVKSYVYSAIRIMVREGKNIEEILAEFDSE